MARIAESQPRFGPPTTIVSYTILALGISLVLQPKPLDLAVAAVFGIGVCRRSGSWFRGRWD